MVYEARYLARNCELKTRLGDIVSHLRHLSHLSQDKTKLLFSFFLILFNYAIQGKFITWLVNSALNCTWKPISHSSLRDSCDIGFRVQFNAEFSRQVVNFPIECFLRSYWLRNKFFFIVSENQYSGFGNASLQCMLANHSMIATPCIYSAIANWWKRRLWEWERLLSLKFTCHVIHERAR